MYVLAARPVNRDMLPRRWYTRSMRYLTLLLFPCLAYAQGFAPASSAPRSVTVQVPDGGLSITGTVAVSSAPPVTGSVAVTSAPAVTGTVSVSSLPAVTGTVGVSSLPAVTGTVTVSSAPPVTGTVAVSTLPAVSISAPDGGVPVSLGAVEVPVNILSAPRLEVAATTAPGTYLAVAGDAAGARLEVAVPSGVSIPAGVAITGTPNVAVTNVPTVGLSNGTQVSLTSASLAALTAATGKGSCTYTETDLAPGATATAMPASPMTGRTAITVTNLTSNRTFKCVPGGTASATAGKVLAISGGYWKWEGAQAGWTLTCICLNNVTPATGCVGQIEEERCYQ